MDAELKLIGGQVLDGSAAPAVRADVAVNGGVISAIGDLSRVEAAEVIDCTGKTITPGFIDIHSHSDWLLPGADHGALIEPFIRQGMTTVVGGNCGFSPAPITEVNRDSAYEASRLIMDEAIDLRWRSMHEFLDALEHGGVSLNIAQLVGHGSVRAAVTGSLNPAAPSPEELKQMETLTREALDAGCIGVSTEQATVSPPQPRPPASRQHAGWAGWSRPANPSPAAPPGPPRARGHAAAA